MDLITSILNNDLVSRSCPIAHFIPRDPSAIEYSNSSSHAAGVYSFSYNSGGTYSGKTPSKHVWLSHAGVTQSASTPWNMQIINYVATTAAILSVPQDHDPYPTTLFFTDNVTSKAWIRKGAK